MINLSFNTRAKARVCNKYSAKRAALGYGEPFVLKFVGVRSINDILLTEPG